MRCLVGDRAHAVPSTLAANSQAACVGERLCLVLLLFCSLAAAMLAPTPTPTPRAPPSERRGQTARAGGV